MDRFPDDWNALTKKLLAGQMLDNAILRDVSSKNGAARCEAQSRGSCLCGARGEPVSGVQGAGRRSTSVRYRSIRSDDASLREAMRAVAGERRRFGYRRIHAMLKRQGIVMNQKKLRRLYREEKLQLRRGVQLQAQGGMPERPLAH